MLLLIISFIRRDHCINESLSAKQWEKNWNFLKMSPDELLKDEKHELLNSKRKEIYIPDHLKVPEAPPISSYIQVKASPTPYPLTTSRMIGWRSGKLEYHIDKYDKERKAQGNLLKRFNWPVEATW